MALQMIEHQTRPAATVDAEPGIETLTDLDATDERGVSTDLVRAYLNGIGRTKLLTAAQEVEPQQADRGRPLRRGEARRLHAGLR